MTSLKKIYMIISLIWCRHTKWRRLLLSVFFNYYSRLFFVVLVAFVSKHIPWILSLKFQSFKHSSSFCNSCTSTDTSLGILWNLTSPSLLTKCPFSTFSLESYAISYVILLSQYTAKGISLLSDCLISLAIMIHLLLLFILFAKYSYLKQQSSCRIQEPQQKLIS